MAYNYEYPYVDPNRHNDDWLLTFVSDAKSFLEEYKKRLEALENRDKALQNEIDKINFWISHYDEHVEAAVKKYIATMIFVEISNAGYIIYNIPERWEDITFNTTGLDIELEKQPDFGYLVLSY